MDEVHRPDARDWISHCVDLSTFSEEFNALLPDGNVFRNSDKDILPAPENSETVEKECSIDQLDCEDEDNIELTKTFTLPPNVKLKVLMKQKEEVDKRFFNMRYRNFAYNNCKYNNYPTIEPIGKRGITDPSSSMLTLPEIMLCVQIYRPEKSLPRYQTLLPPRTPIFKVEQDYYIVGCQYLTELRDVIECVSDYAVPGDFSETPFCEQNIRCKDLMKSGFFYINGVFYNDMRDSAAIDYSKVIIDWAKSADRGIGPFTCASMEETQFKNLNVRLGHPYVYVHQGYCEHLIVFADLRMMNSEDSLKLSDYPMVNALYPKKRIYCMACHLHTARWIVTKNQRLPQDPYFFCQDCFFAFNYDEKNQKMGEFEARKYFDRTLIT